MTGDITATVTNKEMKLSRGGKEFYIDRAYYKSIHDAMAKGTRLADNEKIEIEIKPSRE